MAVPRRFTCVTLRGDVAAEGIQMDALGITFAPRWGLVREGAILAASPAGDGTVVTTAHVWCGRDGTPVVVPAEGDDDARAELVLLQEYRPGAGAKRHPEFDVALDGDEVQVLSNAWTCEGSGGEDWALLIAPLG